MKSSVRYVSFAAFALLALSLVAMTVMAAVHVATLSTAILVAAPVGLVCTAALWWVVDVYGKAAQQAAQTPLVDPLTRLGNVAAFEETLQAEAARALRYDQPAALVLVELDNHDDPPLAELSRLGLATLLSSSREGDRAYRLDTDTFGLILPYANDRTARLAIDRLLRESGQRLLGAPIRVGISNMTGQPAEAVLAQAYAALRRTKEAGIGAVASWDESNEMRDFA